MNKTLVTAYGIVFILLIPFLEISETHLFNADWPAHARLHEAWQLLANALLTAAACLLVWRTQRSLLAHLLCLPLSVSFMLAWALQGFYGGSMLHTDGTEIALLGVNLGVLIVAVLMSGSAVSIGLLQYRRMQQARL